MFMPVCNFVNMYIHVCTMHRDVCTDLPILVQVVRIPDDRNKVFSTYLFDVPVRTWYRQVQEMYNSTDQYIPVHTEYVPNKVMYDGHQ